MTISGQVYIEGKQCLHIKCCLGVFYVNRLITEMLSSSLVKWFILSVLNVLSRSYLKKKCNKVVCAIMHKFAYIKTIECNNVVSSSIGFACSSWNSVKRYDLVALSKIDVCNKVVTMIQPFCTDPSKYD